MSEKEWSERGKELHGIIERLESKILDYKETMQKLCGVIERLENDTRRYKEALEAIAERFDGAAHKLAKEALKESK